MPLYNFLCRTTYLLVALLLWNGIASAKPLKIVIDPGHGGTDHGAVRGDLKESELCLKIGLLLKARLNADPRWNPRLTRENDKYVGLDERVTFANDAQADVFVSIHANSSEDAKVKGTEIYFQNQLAPDEESLFLANLENQTPQNGEALAERGPDTSLQNDVQNIVDDLMRSRKIEKSFELGQRLYRAFPRSSYARVPAHALRQAPFRVISFTKTPALLVEVGYITNEAEKNLLTTASYQKQIAENIYQGLTQGFFQ